MNDTRHAILKSAVSLFAVNGFDGVSMRNIADYGLNNLHRKSLSSFN